MTMYMCSGPRSVGGDTAWNRWSKLIAVCLVVLCVVLLIFVIVLLIKYNDLKTENGLQTSNNNLTIERDQLQTSYNNLTIERDQLQTSYNNLTIERDQLQTSYNNLTIERDQLQTSNNNLTIERDQLQTSYNNLIIARDQLQTSYNNLIIARDQLQTSYNNLIIARDQLQTCNNNLIIARALISTLQRERAELEKFSKLGWIYFSSSIYYISTDKKTWTESRQNCRQTGGADLVIINSREEQKFITKQLCGTAWIGLNKGDRENEWKWVDNTRLITGFWESAEPNNAAGDENCVITGIRSDPVMNWADDPCNRQHNLICEKKIFN